MISRHYLLLTVIMLFFSTVAILTSCARNGKNWDPQDYTAKSGDTLYTIAWRYEQDADDLAAWNGLSSSDRVKAGQRLHIRQPPGFEMSEYKARAEKEIALQAKKIASQPPIVVTPLASPPDGSKQQASSGPITSQDKWLKAKKGDTLYGLSKQTGVSVPQLAQLNQLHKPYIIHPGQTIFLKPLNSQSNSVSSQNTKTASVKSTTRSSQESSQQASFSGPVYVKWRRPAKGAVIKKFNARRNDAKGVEFSGKPGDAIFASADGKVVYSGNGLISYGNLIIIKHNKTYLSAYAYNRRLLVKEGDLVKAGDKIAEMGNKDSQSPRLHFEIRKNGKPVDPLKYIS